MISASHNPWQDNGIKVFGADGYKLSDELEHEIEADIFAHIEQLAAGACACGAPRRQHVAGRSRSCGSNMLTGWRRWWSRRPSASLRVLVDCANGAASSIAPLVFQRLRYRRRLLHIEPNGRNINAGCGALHPEHVAKPVADCER